MKGSKRYIKEFLPSSTGSGKASLGLHLFIFSLLHKGCKITYKKDL